MRKIIFDFKDIGKSELRDEGYNNSERAKPNTEEMYEHIDEIMKKQNSKMGLGIHAVRKEKIKGNSVDEILKGICDDGLDINNGSSVLATVSSLGVSSKLKDYQKEAIKNYRLGSEKAENGVIVLVPTILEGDGEKLYVGFPGMDTNAVGNNHKITCILDELCCGDNEQGKLPEEFVLGYFKEENGKKTFQKNMKHFLQNTDKEKGTFIKSLLTRLTEQQKQISEAVITNNMQKLEQLSVELCNNRDGVLGENTVIQNAMLYLSRNIEPTEKSNKNIKGDTIRSKPRILLDAYKDIKLSDLSYAKETLREGIEQPEKNYEGKEI